METPEQRDARIRSLEERRASRHAQDAVTTEEFPFSVAPGRGSGAGSFGYIPTTSQALNLVGSRAVSFARLFQTQPWIAAAIMRMLTWSIRVPLKAYRRTADPNDRRKALGMDDHPVARMIGRPWDRGTAAHLVMNLLGPMLVHGNSVTVVDDTARSGNLGLLPKDWRFSEPLMPWRDSLEGFRFDIDQPDQSREYSIDKVLHIAWWSPVGPIGTSPLMQLGVTLQIEDAAQRYQRSLFVNGGRPPTAILASDAFLGIRPEDRNKIMAQLRADVTRIYGSPDNGGMPALLPPGLDWKAIGHTPVEAALIDQRKVARDEIAAVYMIPPPMLGILEKATYSNIETQREMIYTECVGPPLVLIEQAINAQLIRDLLQDDEVFVEFDFAGVLRGDRMKQIAAIREAVSSALLSPNEGRNFMDLPSVPDEQMDQYFLPLNNLKQITGPAEQDDTAGELLPVTQPQPPLQPPAPPGSTGGLHVVSGGREYVLEVGR